MDDAELELQLFRLRVQLAFVQELVLKTALLASALESRLSVPKTAEALKEWLDANSAKADEVYGAALRDPALTALYSDEVRSVTDEMKRMVDKIATGAKTAFGH